MSISYSLRWCTCPIPPSWGPCIAERSFLLFDGFVIPKMCIRDRLCPSFPPVLGGVLTAWLALQALRLDWIQTNYASLARILPLVFGAIALVIDVYKRQIYDIAYQKVCEVLDVPLSAQKRIAMAREVLDAYQGKLPC